MAWPVDAAPQKLSFTESEGEPTLIDINGKFMAVATTKGLIKILDLGRVQPRQLGSGGLFQDPKTKRSFGDITQIACNCDGTRVSLLASREVAGSLRVTDNRVFVYNSDVDKVAAYNCGSAHYPRSVYWDPQEPKLLAVETYRVRDSSKTSSGDEAAGKEGDDAEPAEPAGRGKRKATNATDEDPDVEVITLFSTPQEGLILQDSLPLDGTLEGLLALRVPRMYFVGKSGGGDGKDDAAAEGTGSKLQSRPLRDFVGLDQVDPTTRKALLDFSFYLAIGTPAHACRVLLLLLPN